MRGLELFERGALATDDFHRRAIHQARLARRWYGACT